MSDWNLDWLNGEYLTGVAMPRKVGFSPSSWNTCCFVCVVEMCRW